MSASDSPPSDSRPPLRFDIVTLMPEMFAPFLAAGVIGRAFARGLARADFHNPRDFAPSPRRSVDDRPFGGGAGMVLSPGPLAAALRSAKRSNPGETVFLSPQGEKLTDALARELAARDFLILLCGRYAGIDARIESRFVDCRISAGDYVLSGGELPAMSLMDAALRYRRGVLGNEESAQSDSFARSGFFAPPQFTRPAEFEGDKVPADLLSGDHARIEKWRRENAKKPAGGSKD